MVKTKIEELDYLRGFAIIAIVMQHLMGYINYPHAGLGDVVVLSVTWHLISYGLPAFILISGAALFNSYNDATDFKYSKYLKKRVIKILIPYLLWTVFYFYYFNNQTDINIGQQLTGIFYDIMTGRASYHLWYIVMIFQFYLLFPVFRKALMGIKRRVMTERGFFLLLAAFLILHMALMWFYKYVLPQIAGEGISKVYYFFYQYSYLFFGLWIFYFILGGISGIYPGRCREWVSKIAPYNFVISLCLFFYLLYSYSSLIVQLPTGFSANARAFPLYRPVVVIFVLSMIINFYRVCSWLRSNPSYIFAKLLKIVGKYSFSIYLAHPLVLHLLIGNLYGVSFLNPAQKFFLSAFITIIVIIVGTFVLKKALSFIRNLIITKLGQGKAAS